jgi:lipoyl(octanoyl) transferase
MRSVWLGTVPYLTALALQEQLVQEKIAEKKLGIQESEDGTLLLLEHPSVFTYHHENNLETCIYGRKENFLAWARERGIEVLETGRGGQLTYHGAGQLIGYCIMPIPDADPDPSIQGFIKTLARGITCTLAEYGVRSHFEGTGVWVKDKKICSIGIRVRRWISFHGFALNLTEEPLFYFKRIRPCGLPHGHIMASLSEYADVSLKRVVEDISCNIATAFGKRVRIVKPCELGELT